MHLGNKLARYAEAEMPVYRRDPQDEGGGTPGSAQTVTLVNDPSSAAAAPTSALASQVQQPTSEVVVTKTSPVVVAPTTPANAKTTVTPAAVQPTTVIQTTAAAAPNTPVTSVAAAANPTTTPIVSLTSATTTGPSSYVPETIGSTSTAGSAATAAASTSTGPSISGTQVATAVGVVAGIAGGIAALVLGICIYKRRKGKSIQRLGSSEDFTRGGQSPPLLNRSRTMQNRPRRAIDDDDDDFLTPMDTLPNTHRMSQYGTGQHDHTAMYFEDSAQEQYAAGNAYSTPEEARHETYGRNAPGPYDSVYIDDQNFDATQDPHGNHHQQASMDPGFPVQPPAAVVPSNGRYFSGQMDQPHTQQGAGGAGGAIPAYSGMSKYAAYTPQSSGGGSRPGASGYRGPGGPDSGGYM